MTYRAIGLMSGSSLDGLDIVFAELTESGRQWTFEILASACYPYDAEWTKRLKEATSLSALDYQLLHTDYGHYIGRELNRFIEEHQLHYKVALIASHGHTTFHRPDRKMTAQLGDGAAIAAATQLPVVTDLRAMDIAFGGQGAPIVPIGEKFLLQPYGLLLNLGGIANLSVKKDSQYIAFDICPANRVLNMIMARVGKEYDENGQLSATGKVNRAVVDELNALPYYELPFPKSLANDFGTDTIYPLIESRGLSVPDALRTYTEHIVEQISRTVQALKPEGAQQLLITGGGAFNGFVVDQLRAALAPFEVTVEIPSPELIQYKEALIMAFMGVLRWRQEYNVLASVTGATRDSIGGAVWIGQEA